MNGSHARLGTIVTVNLKTLAACLCGFMGWAIWPDTPEWWGLRWLSVILWLAALSGVVTAVGAALRLHRKERVLAEYMAQGGAPKSARLASLDDLKKAGMVQ